MSLVFLLLSVSAALDAQNSLAVVDALGREILFDAPPERIVIAGPATLMIADALYLFETGAERLVGVTRIDQGKGNFLRSIDPDYGRKTILERQVGPEQIAALRPDAVLLKTQLRARLGVRLESLGLPVVYFDFETPEQYQRDISTMGRLLGEQERAREITRYLEGRRSEVLGVTQALPPDERPSVLFLYVDNRGGDRAFNVPPDGWIQTTLVREAGGEPVWTGIPLGSGWSTVTMEQIARWDPENVLFVAYRQDASEVAERLRSDPVWRNLTAVRNGRAWAVPVDFYSWDQPDIRWILGLEWTAYALHPDRFPNLSIRERVYTFYERFYALSREETDRIIFSILEGDLLPERSN
ncbi:MAG: ABC transporter substrate-binding protein [Spirochaetaceae bacterium]